MTTTLFMVRHASHDLLERVLCGRSPGVTLGDGGRVEARRLAAWLGDEGLAAVYSSPLERAVATARPIADAAFVDLRVDDDLHEIDFGEWSGAAFAELEADPRWGEWNRNRGEARAPGGETMSEARDRAVSWLSRMVGEHPGKAVAAVSHRDLIKALLAHALGLPLSGIDRFEVSPASVSVIAAGDWGLKVHSINEGGR